MMVMGRIESSVWSSSSINLYIVSLPWWYCCSHLICEPKCCWCAFIFLKKRFVFFVPSCSCFQTLLPKCTVYSIYIFYIKISLTTVSYNWFAVLMLYLQQMNGHGGLHYSLRGCSVFWWVEIHLVIISPLITSACSGVIDPEGAHKCIFGQMCFRYIKDRFFRQHNQLPNVIVKWHVCQCPVVVVLR